MKGKVTIGNKTITMNCDAATPVWYTQVFHEDFFVTAEKFAQSETNGESVGIYSKIAFIAANQAKTEDLSGLSFLDYTKWLSQFGAYDMAAAVDDIAELYSKQAEKTATPKK